MPPPFFVKIFLILLKEFSVCSDTRTAKIKLNENIDVFNDTIIAYTKAYNFVCETGFPTLETNGVNLHNLTYFKTREYLPSQLAISARMKATESLKSVKALKKKKQNISCPVSKQCSVRLDKNSYTLWLKSKTVSILTINGRKKFSLDIPKYFERYLDWKSCSADLFIDHNRRVFLHIVFEKEITDTAANGNLIGIDRGIKKLAVTSTNKFFGGGKVKRISNKYREQRKQLQSKKTRSAQRHLAAVSGKERRFRTDTNHCISKQIVESLAPGDTIVLEKLTGIRDRSRKLTKEQREAGKKTVRKDQRRENNNWSFFQLDQFLTYKASFRGISVVYVDARYTSQRCSKCGHIKRANRKSQSIFKCKLCGFSHNADLNAAKNICLKYLDTTGYPDTANVNLPNDSRKIVNAPRLVG